MLLIDTYLDKSPIQGLGLFAKEPIAQGAVIWRLDPRFDRLIEVEVYESMTGAVKSYLDRYCYPRRSDPRYIVFEADDARYMNHASDPNFGFASEDVAVALRDIAAGEELTCDYNVFFDDGFEFLGDR
ncbi:MAG: SET domain-containing protein-lysine N-methyltransferase [Hyphomicrobiales bacterium]|nr:SET domain-containing protein-lysine N-methyltransferase [Hyphomicrobiales bacterium]